MHQSEAFFNTSDDISGLGTLNKGQLRRILGFCDTQVSQVMVPINDVLCFDRHAPTGEVVAQSLATYHYRYPVYENNRWNIIGLVIMTSRDMLEPNICDQPLEARIQPVLYVTDRQSLDEIVPMIRDRTDRLAVVVDDVGAAVGIVSFEDMLAIAIGDIDIGRDCVDVSSRRLATTVDDDRSFVVDGHMPVIKLNELIGKDLFSTRLKSVNGIILEKTHFVPKTGDVIECSGFQFIVEEANERTVLRVRLRQCP